MSRSAKPAASALSQQLSRAVTELRQGASLSHSALCARAGLSESYYYTRLRGDAAFDANDLDRLAPALGVTPLELVAIASEGVNAGHLRVDGVELARRLRFLRLTGSAHEHHFEDHEVAQLEVSGRRACVERARLEAAADASGVPREYLTVLADTNGAARVEAEVSFRRALDKTDAETANVRAIAGVVPVAALQDLTRVILTLRGVSPEQPSV